MADSRDPKDNLSDAFLRKKIAEVKSSAGINFSLTVPYLIMGGLAQMANEAKPLIGNSCKSKLWHVFGSQPGILPGLKWIGYGFATLSLVTGFVFKNKQKKFEKELKTLQSKHGFSIFDKAQLEVLNTEEHLDNCNKVEVRQLVNSPSTIIQSNIVQTTPLQDRLVNASFQNKV